MTCKGCSLRRADSESRSQSPGPAGFPSFRAMDGASARALAAVLEVAQLQPNIIEELMLDRERAAMQREDFAVQLDAEREAHQATRVANHGLWRDFCDTSEELAMEKPAHSATRARLAAERAAHRATRAHLDAERHSEDEFLDRQILVLQERREEVTERREIREGVRRRAQ